jgi:hypothetical protein
VVSDRPGNFMVENMEMFKNETFVREERFRLTELLNAMTITETRG